LKVDEQSISLLTARAEGWPAGLRLAALALRQQHTPGQIAANAVGDQRYVMDYLLTEVLSELPISIQEFLIKTSILDQLCSSLCETVTSMVDRTSSGQSILKWLERAGLFLTPMDDQQRWYRCHHLFRQLLRDRLQQLHGAAEITVLQLRASAWFAENGYLDEALQHALDANDMAAAVQIVAQYRHELMNQSQWQRLDRWAHLFPREVIDEQPDLLLIEVWMNFIQQRLGEVPVLLDRVAALLSGLPPQLALHLQGEVESRRSALLYWSGDLERSMTLAEQALEKVPLNWWHVRVYARLFLSAGYQISGNLVQAFTTLYETGEPDQGPIYQNQLLGAACVVHYLAADLMGMAQAALQIVSRTAPSDRAELVTFARFYLGHYYYQRNDLASADKYLLPLVMQPYAMHAACFLNSAVVLARIRQTQGRPQEARDIADLIASFALETRSAVVLSGARAFQAELALRQERLAEASQWAAHWVEQYGSFRRVPVPLPFVPPVVLAQVLLKQDTPASRQQARELLAQMDDYFTSIHYTAIRIQVLALQALLHSAEGDEPQALAALSNSIALAAPGGFLRLFVDLGKPLRPLLRKLAQRGVSPAYIDEILAAFGLGEESPDERRPGTEPRKTATAATLSAAMLLTNREHEVLALLARRYTDKEIAEALVISPKTVNNHIHHLGAKLGVHGRRAIVQAAKDQGLLS
ncbi:MAG: hypothetical protein HGB05_09715, partial [Chloroflexi bacterium]|nr:hypothetical protein [Chloroflexota bacterium]